MSDPIGTLHDMTSALRERMARHGLADRPCASPVEAAARTTALQAQDTPASRLGVRARAAGCTDVDVGRAIDHDRTLVRTWLMRGTIHLVAADDLRWLVRLIGPSIVRKYGTRWRQLGLTDRVLDASLAVLPEVLRDGPRTLHEIRTGFAERGLVIDSADPQAHAHVVVNASAVGLICRGPDRGRTNTFALLDDWLPDAPAGPHGDDALAELARRYFAAFSPATAADFTTWSGLASGRAIALIRDDLVGVEVDGRPGFRLGDVEPARGVRLLPAFDNYLVGYRHRATIVDPARHARVYQGGMIRPVVLRDGAAIGTWALKRGAGRVVVSPFARFPARVAQSVRAEAADIGRFLDAELSVEVAAPLDG